MFRGFAYYGKPQLVFLDSIYDLGPWRHYDNDQWVSNSTTDEKGRPERVTKPEDVKVHTANEALARWAMQNPGMAKEVLKK